MSLLAEYKRIDAEYKKLEKERESLKKSIFAAMDEQKNDMILIDGVKAERKLVPQERIDNEKVRNFFGVEIKDYLKEIEVVKLIVI